MQREIGGLSLERTTEAIRRSGLSMANPVHAVGFIVWMRRKELRAEAVDVAAALECLAELDERSAAGWPIAPLRKRVPSALRSLARRARSALGETVVRRELARREASEAELSMSLASRGGVHGRAR